MSPHLQWNFLKRETLEMSRYNEIIMSPHLQWNFYKRETLEIISLYLLYNEIIMSQHLQWNFYKKTGLIHIWWCFYNFIVLFYREEIYGNERAEGGSQPPLMIVFYKKYTNIDPGWHIRYLGNTDLHCFHIYTGLWVMVFNTTFNNISVISWRSVLLVEETEVPWENYRPAASHWQTLSHNAVSSTPRLSEGWTHNFSGDRHWLHR
jgi:hypothetical protein